MLVSSNCWLAKIPKTQEELDDCLVAIAEWYSKERKQPLNQHPEMRMRTGQVATEGG